MLCKKHVCPENRTVVQLAHRVFCCGCPSCTIVGARDTHECIRSACSVIFFSSQESDYQLFFVPGNIFLILLLFKIFHFHLLLFVFCCCCTTFFYSTYICLNGDCSSSCADQKAFHPTTVRKFIAPTSLAGFSTRDSLPSVCPATGVLLFFSSRRSTK